MDSKQARILNNRTGLALKASQVITTRSSKDMAKLALNGQIVAVPKNYIERAYQVSIYRANESYVGNHCDWKQQRDVFR